MEGVVAAAFGLDEAAAAVLGLAVQMGDYSLGRRGGPSEASSKRKRTATTVTRKDRDDGDGFFTGQLNTYSVVHGKRKRDVEHIAKLIRRSAGYVLERIGACNRLTDSVGAFQLRFGRPNTAYNYNDYVLPCHVLELTSRWPDGGYVRSTNYPLNELRMLDVGSNSVTRYQPLNSRAADGTGPAVHYQVLNSNTDNGTVVNSRRANTAILEYSNIKLLLRAPTSRPGKFRVDIVQFLHEDIVPVPLEDCYPVAPAVPEELPVRDAFYERFLSDYLYNPIKRQSKGVGRHVNENVRLIKSWEKEFAPDSSNNLDAQGQQFHLNMFIRHNRFCNFENANGTHFGGAGAASKLDDDVYLDEIATGRMNGNSPTESRSRVFMIIRATNWDAKKETGDFDPATECSYDMEVRNRWVYKSVGAI